MYGDLQQQPHNNNSEVQVHVGRHVILTPLAL